MKGYLALILHAHLPFVRHPEDENFLEEKWLYEAITETYIPLIRVFENLVRDGIHFRLTMSVTPPLASMLSDSLLQARYLRHLHQLIELAEREVQRTRWQADFHDLAQMYRNLFQGAEACFNRYGGNLLGAFRYFQEIGKLEIVASAATHGFLPLLGYNPEATWAQITTGVEAYQRFFGQSPQGFWLPECGYNPNDDVLLAQAGVRYFFTDSHGILFASPRPKYAVYAPIYCPQSGVAAFGRDWESSKQVWSANEGYPGDPDYREFYRDIGFDLDFEYLRAYLHPDGIRTHTGIKYYRITGKNTHKEPYNPFWAREKAAIHAGNFMFNREKQIEYLAQHMDRPPLIIAPYDAELFGHWWFEGPQWLDFLIRKITYDQDTIQLITPSEYLNRHPRNQVSAPPLSSWGYKGYNEVWLEGSNDWIYRHLHKAAERMVELARTYTNPTDLERRALNQAARELLLAQSSDWAFIMKTGTMVEYAQRRTKEHIHNFTRLYEDIRKGMIDPGWLSWLESSNNIFPFLNYQIYTSVPQPKAPAVV